MTIYNEKKEGETSVDWKVGPNDLFSMLQINLNSNWNLKI